MPHCGSYINLCGCMFVSSPDVTSSLPTHCNQSPIDTCSGAAMLHPTFTLCPNHISMDCSVLHFFSTSSPCGENSKVTFACNFCTTVGSMFICLYTNPALILSFMNAGNNACPLVNSIVKITVLWQLSPVRIRGTLTVEEVDIFIMFFI